MKNESIVSLSEATKNLSALVAQATAQEFLSGLSWYTTAHTDSLLAAQEVGCDFELFCKVVAILSPATHWNNNIKAATSVVSQYQNKVVSENLTSYGRYYANAKKAYLVLSGEKDFVKSGSGKTYSFYQNIFNPSADDYITVDFHAYNGSLGGSISWKSWEAGEAKLNKATYSTIASAIRIVAEQYNIFPLQAQAVCWLTQKRLYPGR